MGFRVWGLGFGGFGSMGQRGVSIYHPWFLQGLGPRVVQDSELEDVGARALASGLGASLKL